MSSETPSDPADSHKNTTMCFCFTPVDAKYFFLHYRALLSVLSRKMKHIRSGVDNEFCFDLESPLQLRTKCSCDGACVARSYPWMWSFTQSTLRSYGLSVLISLHASAVESVCLELRGRRLSKWKRQKLSAQLAHPAQHLLLFSFISKYFSQFAFVVCQTAIWAPLCFIFGQF